jgi:hypothetical protein
MRDDDFLAIEEEIEQADVSLVCSFSQFHDVIAQWGGVWTLQLIAEFFESLNGPSNENLLFIRKSVEKFFRRASSVHFSIKLNNPFLPSHISPQWE